MNIAFTGHREFHPEALREPLTVAIKRVFGDAQSVTFWCGCAVGFDLAAAEAVLELRDKGEPVQLIAVVPYEAQAKGFSESEQQQYQRVIKQADRVLILEDEYSHGVFYRRNDYLLDHAELLIVYSNGDKSGGTAYTIRGAKRRKIRTINVYPTAQLSLEF